jgi:hypothetical protein
MTSPNKHCSGKAVMKKDGESATMSGSREACDREMTGFDGEEKDRREKRNRFFVFNPNH